MIIHPADIRETSWDENSMAPGMVVDFFGGFYSWQVVFLVFLHIAEMTYVTGIYHINASSNLSLTPLTRKSACHHILLSKHY